MNPLLLQIAINKGIPVPLYYQLKQEILRMIADGGLRVGDALPTESELCEALGISRPTVRQAFGELVSEGCLYRRKGKGTFISSPKIDAGFFARLESFNDEMRQKGLDPSTRVLAFGVTEPEPGINQKLLLPPRDRLIHLERLRSAGGEPVVHVRTWLPYAGLAGLLDEDFVTSSLYTVLENKYSISVFKATREIEAVNATSREASLLQIEKGDAVCRVRTIAFTKDGKPVEYSIAAYRGDRNRFNIDLYR